MNLLLAFWEAKALDMGRNLRPSGHNVVLTNIALNVAIITAVAFGTWLMIRIASEREKRGYRSPRKLFRELCQAHQIDRAGRGMLKRLAAAHRLPPMRLFLEPERFDCMALGGKWATQRTQLELLRDTIFGRKLHDDA